MHSLCPVQPLHAEPPSEGPRRTIQCLPPLFALFYCRGAQVGRMSRAPAFGATFASPTSQHYKPAQNQGSVS